MIAHGPHGGEGRPSDGRQRLHTETRHRILEKVPMQVQEPGTVSKSCCGAGLVRYVLMRDHQAEVFRFQGVIAAKYPMVADDLYAMEGA